MADRYQVFLSHNSKDLFAAQTIAARLAEKGVRVWLDTSIDPGKKWMEVLEAALEASDYCVVLIGSNGIGDWQKREVELALDRGKVIPVLLPDAPADVHKALPGFLGGLQAVKFQDSLDDALAINKLATAVVGRAEAKNELLECPYRGLRFFDVEHSRFFRGREELTNQLVGQVRSLIAQQEKPRFLAIVGCSGSGKSSVARAGLIATLKHKSPANENWSYAICRPESDPLQSLAVAIGTLSAGERTVAQVLAAREDFRKSESALDISIEMALGVDRDRHCLILVDQFEECFNLCDDEAMRKAFIDNLLHTAKAGRRGFIVICLRADEYGDCIRYPDLAAGLTASQALVGAMSPQELRRAIDVPAIEAGVEMEPGLVDLLLSEVECEPGCLPLLQYTLQELWTRREGRRLTVSAYRELGKVAGVLENRCNEVFGRLSADQKLICRQVFLRLVQPGEGGKYVRRPVRIAELFTAKYGETAIHSVIEALAAENARLVILFGETAEGGDATVEIAHESLIRNWSLLRGWLDEDREFQLWRKRFWMALSEWDRTGRNRDALQRGSLLDEAIRWRAKRQDDLNAKELAFIDAGIRLRITERRNRQKMFAGVALLAIVLSGIIYVTAEQNASRKYAEDADRQAQSGDPAAPVRLALKALDKWHTREAEEALHEAMQLARGAAIEGHTGAVLTVAFSSDAKFLFTGSDDGTAKLWGDKYNEVRTYPHPPRVLSVAISPDGSILATAGADGNIRLWRPDSDTAFAVLGPQSNAVTEIAFEADGKRLLSSCQDGGVFEWDLQTSQPAELLRQKTAVRAVAASPDGKLYATGDVDGNARVWDAHTHTEPFRLDPHRGPINDLAFSPDGKLLATASDDGTAQLWDVRSHRRVFVLSRGAEHPAIRGIAFSPAGDVVVTAELSGAAFVWSIKSGKDLLTLRGRTGPTQLTAVAFPRTPEPGGRRRVAIAGKDQVVRVYELNLNLLRTQAP